MSLRSPLVVPGGVEGGEGAGEPKVMLPPGVEGGPPRTCSQVLCCEGGVEEAVRSEPCDEALRCGGGRCCGCVCSCTPSECATRVCVDACALTISVLPCLVCVGLSAVICASAIAGVWGALAVSALTGCCFVCAFSGAPEISSDETAGPLGEGQKRVMGSSWCVTCVGRCFGYEHPDQFLLERWGNNQGVAEKITNVQRVPCCGLCVAPLFRPAMALFFLLPASIFLYALGFATSIIVDDRPARAGDNPMAERAGDITAEQRQVAFVLSCIAWAIGTAALLLIPLLLFALTKGRERSNLTIFAISILPIILLELVSLWFPIHESAVAANGFPGKEEVWHVYPAALLAPRLVVACVLITIFVPVCSPSDHEIGKHNFRCLFCCGCFCCCPRACRRRCFGPEVVNNFSSCRDVCQCPDPNLFLSCFVLCLLSLGSCVFPTFVLALLLVVGGIEANQNGRCVSNNTVALGGISTILLAYVLPTLYLALSLGISTLSPFGNVIFRVVLVVAFELCLVLASLLFPTVSRSWPKLMPSIPDDQWRTRPLCEV